MSPPGRKARVVTEMLSRFNALYPALSRKLKPRPQLSNRRFLPRQVFYTLDGSRHSIGAAEVGPTLTLRLVPDQPV